MQDTIGTATRPAMAAWPAKVPELEHGEYGEVLRQTPRVLPGWVELQEGHWVRAATITAVDADELPEEPDGLFMRTTVRADGQEHHSVYSTAAVLAGILEAETSQT